MLVTLERNPEPDTLIEYQRVLSKIHDEGLASDFASQRAQFKLAGAASWAVRIISPDGSAVVADFNGRIREAGHLKGNDGTAQICLLAHPQSPGELLGNRVHVFGLSGFAEREQNAANSESFRIQECIGRPHGRVGVGLGSAMVVWLAYRLLKQLDSIVESLASIERDGVPGVAGLHVHPIFDVLFRAERVNNFPLLR